MDAAAPSRYGLHFRCPENVVSAGQVVVDDRSCPLYVIDLEDIMAQPVLVMDPFEPRLVAFHALHGGRGFEATQRGEAPSQHSRSNALHQPHTTFQSSSSGSSWIDNRYYAPDSLGPKNRPNRTLYGEDNAAVLDVEGRLYLGSVYAYRDEHEPEYHFAVALWKSQRINRPVAYHHGLKIITADGYARISDLHLVFVKDANRVLALWRESPPNATAGLQRAVVRAYWAVPEEGAIWEPIASAQTIGPCRSITNPIAYGPRVYLGCVPDAGYDFGGSTVAMDLVQMHSIEAVTWTAARHGPTTVSAENGVLVNRGNGHMALLGASVDGTGKSRLMVSYGQDGTGWGEAADYGVQFSQARVGTKVLEARVTAAAYTTTSSYLHVLFLEEHQDNGGVLTRERTFSKTYGVIRPDLGFQGEFNDLIQFGSQESQLTFALSYRGGLDEHVFGDLHDSILVWKHPKTGKERIFVAFGDYGSVRFGEVVEDNALPAIFLPTSEFPPIPLGAPEANYAMESALAGLIFGVMMLRLLLSRRRKMAEVAAPA